MTPAHPFAEIFPLITGAAFAELVDDIRRQGLQDPIVRHEGLILDGRNRLRACEAAGVEPRYVDFDGDDPLAFVVSKNLRRRQLRDSQRALIAARLANARQGRRNAKDGTVTQTEAAQLLNVRVTTLGRGRLVVEHAIPQLRQMVEDGLVSVSAAAKVACLDERRQAEIVEKGVEAIPAEARRLDARRGRLRRADFAVFWKRVDQLCDALEASRIDLAHSAARQLVRDIDDALAAGGAT